MTSQKPLRLWPGVALVTLQWFVLTAVPAAFPDVGMYSALGGVFVGLAVVLWWVFFSRAPWLERLGAVALMIAGLYGTSRVAHESIAKGMMGLLLVIYAIPVLSLALVVWAVASRRLSRGWRRASMVATILLACGVFALLRTSGVAGEGRSDFSWRWTPSPEERLLARADEVPVVRPPARAVAENPKESPESPVAGVGRDPLTAPQVPAEVPAVPVPEEPTAAAVRADWPGFRGAERNGVVRDVRIDTDWARVAPVERWRRPIGPGWSSFAVNGDLFYTQEQRGDDEVVACYRVATGEPVWRHRNAVRFWESNAGAGPRATPTLSAGRVYALGATGILNALDAASGAVAWSRNVASETGTLVPIWGFAASPLIVDDLVIVAAAGKLAAYDIGTGHLRWSGPVPAGSYSSPHRATLDSVSQVLLLTDTGASGVAPATGAVLWEHAWPGAAIVQPAIVADDGVLVSTGGASGGAGVRRLAVANGPSGWTVSERWTSTGLKPYFNDFVVHAGHAYGFDGSILACIDLEDGRRRWKGGRYGYGQLVLLPEQDVLLVLSEDGELVLVGAAPDQFRELARFPAIRGKTWNHPVLVGDTLLVRNGEEMAAFRLPLAPR